MILNDVRFCSGDLTEIRVGTEEVRKEKFQGFQIIFGCEFRKCVGKVRTGKEPNGIVFTTVLSSPFISFYNSFDFVCRSQHHRLVGASLYKFSCTSTCASLPSYP